MMPKAQLLSDGGLHFEFTLAKELHMTHKRLLLELGQGEIARWRAVFELEHEQYDQARHKAEHDAEVAQKMKARGFG
jgi:hypothetical protein